VNRPQPPAAISSASHNPIRFIVFAFITLTLYAAG
jgi:hypothetical protein